MKTAIKYVEKKSDGVRGTGRITRVQFSKSGRTICCGNRTLAPLGGFAFKANYFDIKTFEEFWVSSPRRDGNDSLFPVTINIDEDVRESYWLGIRGNESHLKKTKYKSLGRSKRERERLEKSVRRHDIDRRFQAP